MPYWPAIGAGISATAGIAGNLINSSAAGAMNEKAADVATMQADLNYKEFQQAQDFNESNMLQNQKYATNMSDTAMQRRSEDLRAAGLNPALAVSQGGASSPMVSGNSSPGVPSNAVPSFTNPGAAWGNLGSQVQGAVNTGMSIAQAEAGIKQTNAQTNNSAQQAALFKAQADKMLGVDTDAAKQGINESQARTQLIELQQQSTAAQTQLTGVQIQQAYKQMDQIQANIENLSSITNLNMLQSSLKDIEIEASQLSLQQQQLVMPWAVQSMIAAAKKAQLGIPEEQSKSDFWSSQLGQQGTFLGKIGTFIKGAISIFK